MKKLLPTLWILLISATISFAAPVAIDDDVTVSEGGTVNVTDTGATSVLANDTNTTDSAAVLSGPVHDQAFALAANGQFTYEHDGSETTTDSFVYVVSDGTTTDTATVNITIVPVNDNGPVAVDDLATVDEGGTISSVDVLANDTDADLPGDTLSATLTGGGPTNGTLTLAAGGFFTYTHDGSETTTDTFDYIVSDGNATDVGTVNISVTPVNDPPVALDDINTVDEGGTLSVAATGVLANDSDVDGPNALVVLTTATTPNSIATTNGIVQISADGAYTYIHDGSETTSDFFDYTVSDGGLNGARTARVDISVTPVSDSPPVANPESAVTTEAGSVSVLDGGATSVLANDTDAPDNSVLSVVNTGPNATDHGTVVLLANGEFTYTHDGGESISDFFVYSVTDGTDVRAATVSITIAPVDDAPDAADDAATVDEGKSVSALTGGATSVLDNDTDAEGEDLTVANPGTRATAHGTVVLEADGEFTYTHDGSETTTDSFDYEITDGALTDSATVDITVNPVNEAPVANDDHVTVTEGGSADNLDDGSTSVLANDTDQDTGDSLTVNTTPVTPPGHGNLTLGANGTFTYTHDGTENLTDSFVYQISDGGGLTANATVLIWVTGVNDNDPVANDDIATTTTGGTLSAPNVLANDTDADIDAVLTVTSTPVSDPAHGTLVLGADGYFTYTHDGGDSTTDTFTYEISDGNATDTATVDIGIFDPINFSTQPMSETITTNQSVVLMAVTDAAGDNVTYQWFEGQSGDTDNPVDDSSELPILDLRDNVVDGMSATTFINGDDALVLKKDGVIIDMIGVVGVDPAAGFWGSGDVTTSEDTLVRKADVTSGDADGFVGNEDDLTGEWTGFPQDTFDDLGMHTGTGTATDLFFSEYIEGSSNNKAIEIYNGTGAVVDLTDYVVESFNNGRTAAEGPTNTLNLIDLADDLADGAVLVVVNDSAAGTVTIGTPDGEFDTGALDETTSFWVQVSDGDITVNSDTATVTVLDVFSGVDIDGFPGWKASPWYKNYFAGFWPWIYHDEAGWQFVSSGSLEEEIFVWDLGLGFWAFLNEDSWRHMYVFSQSPFFPEGWYFSFAGNTPELRFFQDLDGNIISVPPQ